MLPFTKVEFLQLFATFNSAIWPLQTVATVLGVAAVLLLWRRFSWSDRAISAVLGVLWAFVGAAYHIGFFAAINPSAYAFGAAFVLGALIFLVEGTIRGRIEFAAYRDAWSVPAWLLIAYGLVVYPLLGLLGTHPYPETPLFGVAPCPTTIFTIGLLLLARHRRLWLLAAVPLLWSLVGGSAAVLLDVPQDWGLLVAAATWVVAATARHFNVAAGGARGSGYA